jgi:hypothetical protein
VIFEFDGRQMAIWVQMVQTGDQTGKVQGNAFSVAPTANDVDHLKDAIKAKAASTVTCDAFQLTIYAPDPDGDVEVVLPGGVKAKYKEVTKQSTTLTANTANTPYLFELP